MGLHAIAYERIEVCANPPMLDPETHGPGLVDDNACYEQGLVRVIRPCKDFAASYLGLPEGGAWVKTSGKTADVGNSYGGHGVFRHILAELIGAPGREAARVVWGDPDAWADKPFYELIHFADNEGAIGSEACTDLANDFTAMRAKAEARKFRDDFDRDWFLDLYDEWAQVFALAAGAGMVRFT